MKKLPTGVVFSPDFKRHEPGRGHPESPNRMDAVSRALSTTELAPRLDKLNPRPADKEQVLLVHWERLYDEIMATAGKDATFLDADTVASGETAALAHLAAGSVLTGIEKVMDGTHANAFAFPRPPGHHAKPDKAMGFCFFNNVAVGAMFALTRFQFERVLVVDFDVHHGNGTQKAFYTSPEVLYISTHQSPHYPGTGALNETGKDEGEGFTLNVPMPAGMGDAEYLRVFREVVLPVGLEYKPQIILVSAGFDAHRDDPLGGMALTAEGFAAITGQIVELARSTCEGKVVFVLEGGYNLEALEKSVAATLRVLTGGLSVAVDGDGAGEDLVKEVRRVHGTYWSSLRS